RQERPQSTRTVVVSVRDRLGIDCRNDHHVVLSAAKNYVEALFAATLIDGSKIHRHPAIPVWRIADAEDYDIALITLYVFKVLDEQTVELAIVLAEIFLLEPRRKAGVAGGKLVKGALDLGLLRL